MGFPTIRQVRAYVVRGGGAAAWGNAALGGVIQILSEKNVCHLIDDKFRPARRPSSGVSFFTLWDPAPPSRLSTNS